MLSLGFSIVFKNLVIIIIRGHDRMEINNEDKIILDPKNDVVFQRIFESPENEDILISFLNALRVVTEKEKIYR
jgi:hypothetical protein